MALIEIEDRAAVRTLALNRPDKRNALNGPLIAELREVLLQCAADPAVRCVVVKGNGPLFSAGMDFNELAELARRPEQLRQLRAAIVQTWNLLEEMAKPTVAQIHGACLGGALELALACDLRTIAEDAVVGLLETRIGLVPDVGGCSRLPGLVGVGRAKELVMASRLIDGKEAERIGLANRVAPAAGLEAATRQLVGELLACAPTAVARAKRVIDTAARPTLGTSLELEVTAQELCASSADFAAGVKALQCRQQPDFRPKEG